MHLHHLLFGVLEVLCDEVDRLVLSYGVLLKGCGGGIEGTQLGFPAQTVLQLAKGRQQAGSVGLELAVLATQPKFDREPEALQKTSY